MGRIVTPTYAVKMTLSKGFADGFSWYCRQYGRPSDERLSYFVEEFERSCVDGVNRHLGQTFVRTAKVIRQSTGEVVASYEAPMFQVIA